MKLIATRAELEEALKQGKALIELKLDEVEENENPLSFLENKAYRQRVTNAIKVLSKKKMLVQFKTCPICGKPLNRKDKRSPNRPVYVLFKDIMKFLPDKAVQEVLKIYSPYIEISKYSQDVFEIRRDLFARVLEIHWENCENLFQGRTKDLFAEEGGVFRVEANKNLLVFIHLECLKSLIDKEKIDARVFVRQNFTKVKFGYDLFLKIKNTNNNKKKKEKEEKGKKGYTEEVILSSNVSKEELPSDYSLRVVSVSRGEEEEGEEGYTEKERLFPGKKEGYTEGEGLSLKGKEEKVVPEEESNAGKMMLSLDGKETREKMLSSEREGACLVGCGLSLKEKEEARGRRPISKKEIRERLLSPSASFFGLDNTSIEGGGCKMVEVKRPDWFPAELTSDKLDEIRYRLYMAFLKNKEHRPADIFDSSSSVYPTVEDFRLRYSNLSELDKLFASVNEVYEKITTEIEHKDNFDAGLFFAKMLPYMHDFNFELLLAFSPIFYEFHMIGSDFLTKERWHPLFWVGYLLLTDRNVWKYFYALMDYVEIFWEKDKEKSKKALALMFTTFLKLGESKKRLATLLMRNYQGMRSRITWIGWVVGMMVYSAFVKNWDLHNPDEVDKLIAELDKDIEKMGEEMNEVERKYMFGEADRDDVVIYALDFFDIRSVKVNWRDGAAQKNIVLTENHIKVIQDWQELTGIPFDPKWLPDLHDILSLCYPYQIREGIKTALDNYKFEILLNKGGFGIVANMMRSGRLGWRIDKFGEETVEKYLENLQDDGMYPKSFKEFWEAYPKKVKKRQAMIEFIKTISSGIPAELLVEAAKRFAEYAKNKDDKYIKFPHNFLRDKVYKDFIDFQEEKEFFRAEGIDKK